MSAPHPLDCRNILYTPPGAMSGTMGDIDVIFHEGTLHLFHLVLPNHDVIAHAVSDDGFRWRAVDDAIHTGKNGCFDDDMLWTMQVVRHPSRNLFLMYYTGCSRKEHGQIQRIGLAVSEDLIHWSRHSECPILEARSPHYLDDLQCVGFVSCRDPFVFWDDDGRWHMVFTARTPSGGRFRSGCVGHAVSEDGCSWSLLEPLFAPSEFEDMEVPSLVRGPKGWAMFFNDFGRATTHCRVAPSLTGPWRRPTRSELLPSGQVTWRFCDWQGQTLLWNWLRAGADWPRRYCPVGSPFNSLAPPKVLNWNREGEPELKSFPGWETLTVSSPQSWEPAALAESPSWSSFPGGFAFDGLTKSSLFGEGLHDHFLLNFSVDIADAARFGVHFRVSETDEEMMSVEFVPVRAAVELHRTQIFRPSVPRLKIKAPTLCQTAPFLVPLSGGSVDCRLIACGEYLEFSLGGCVVISHVSYALKEGKIGLFASEGRVRFRDVVICPLMPPWQEISG